LTPATVILALKIAVAAVTVLLVASIIAIASGRRRLHGRINTVFFCLTIATVLVFEAIVRFVDPNLTAGFSAEQREALVVHLGFSIPAAVLLPVMLYTGLKRHRTVHLTLAAVFLVLWAGTFVTGIFYLPHSFEAKP
jgi:uncharacterized membrane protein YozB (DUF420 family)